MTDYHNSYVFQPPLTMADKALAHRKRKEGGVSPADATVHLSVSFNNTQVCIERLGVTLGSSSAGACDFKGTKKGTAFAARVAFEKAMEKACYTYKAKYKHNLERVIIYIKGAGQGSEQAIMALKNKGIEVTKILNVTSIPHNGCRPPKRRRV